MVVIPSLTINTEKNRSTLAKRVSLEDATFNLAHSSFLTACFLEKKYDLLKLASKDMLHQTRRMKNYEILFEVQKTALENKAILSTLSGSGSTFFNIAYKDEAKYLYNKLKDKFKHFEVKILEFDNKGFEILQNK